MIIATAPGRCGIVGNPSDMYGGSVLSISTTQRARCEIKPSEELTIRSSDESAVISGPDDLVLRGDRLDIARAVLRWFDIDAARFRFSIQLSTDIPMQAGMAGSTALVVAAVGALARHLGMRLNPWAIAETARKIEFREMSVLCGLQDQHMAVFGGLNFMDFTGKEALEQRDDEPLATIEPLAPHTSFTGRLLLAHTGIRHHSGTVHKSPRQRWLEGDPQVIKTYCRLAELARRAKRAWIEEDWIAVGALMNENHYLVSELGGSGPENDHLIHAARSAGALGAKLAGAGGGGTIICLVDNADHVREALLEAGADSIMRPEPGPGLTVSDGRRTT